METHHHQQQQQQNHDLGNKNNNNNNNSSSSSSYLCRQSTSRWTPTSDQIRILKELYYNNGIRSPTADQIQRIAARLRHYGKIEGKNVFYWFQNHKARERQKKRFTPPLIIPRPQPQHPPPTSPYSDQHHLGLSHFYNQQPKLYTSNHILPPEGGGSFSSQSSIPISCGYGSVTMDKSFMECSISPVFGGRVTNNNFGPWVKLMHEDETPGEEDEGTTTSTQIETLPLFPIHGGDTHYGIFNMDSSSSEYNNGVYFTGGNWFRSDSRTSLELSLNSYGYYN